MLWQDNSMFDPYFYSEIHNEKNHQSGEHRGDTSQKEEYNIDTVIQNHAWKYY